MDELFNKGNAAGQGSAAPTGNKPPQQPPLTPAVNPMKKFQEETMDTVLGQIKTLQDLGDLKLPENYAVGNQLKQAWLHLVELKDWNDKLAI